MKRGASWHDISCNKAEPALIFNKGPICFTNSGIFLLYCDYLQLTYPSTAEVNSEKSC